MIKRLGKRVIDVTRPWIWRLAEAYDIRVERPCHPTGQHPVILCGDPVAAAKGIPKSVIFNTRSGRIVVGENTVFGENVQLLTGKHANLEEALRLGVPLQHVPERGRDITIGSGCYIGGGAIVIGPVTIGDHAVVGAGSVVTHDVGPRTFVAGVPARVVRGLQIPETGASPAGPRSA